MDPPAAPTVAVAYRFGRRPILAGDWRFRALSKVDSCGRDALVLTLQGRHAQLPPHPGRLLQHWGEEGAGQGMSLYLQPGGYLLRFAGLADFDLRFDPPSIAMRAMAGVDDNTLEHLLVDQVLPRYLAHEGELLVHASALTLHDRTVLFLGESGWGKSTLAALLHRAGHRLLSDDCVQIAPGEGGWRAWPTYPSLRLFDDSLDHAFPWADGVTAVAAYSRKRRLPVAAPEGDAPPATIAALYLLDEPSDQFSEVRIAPMRPVSACLELMRHAFKLDMSNRGRTQALFATCSELARAVPAYSLDYPRDYGQSEALVQAVAGHVASLGPATHDEEDANARR